MLRICPKLGHRGRAVHETRTAQKYAEDFKGEVSLEEFKAVRAELQVATAAAV
jgi:hypothetical protein